MTSRMSVLAAVLLLPFVVSSPYDCRNPGEENCKHGKCHFYGYCDCPPNFSGYNCGLYIPLITPENECSVICQHNGTCYNGHQCFCTSDYVGDRCEFPRTGLQCKYDEIEVTANRDLSFTGETYIWDKQDNCTLQRVQPDVKGMHTYKITIPLNDASDPCMPEKTVDPVTGDITYSTEIVSAYIAGEYGSRDSVQAVSCVYKAKKPGKVEDITDNKFFVQLSATDAITGNAVHRLPENKLIHLNFAPKHVKGVKDVTVDFLEIYSYNDTTLETKSKSIVVNGCVNETLQSVIGPLKSYSELKDGVYVAKVQMKSFILMEGLPLLFNYRLNFCTEKCKNPCSPTKSTNAAPTLTVV